MVERDSRERDIRILLREGEITLNLRGYSNVIGRWRVAWTHNCDCRREVSDIDYYLAGNEVVL